MNLSELEVITLDNSSGSVVTCYVKCRCEMCKKEFMGFAGSVICNETRCNREWMDKNIHSKLELAQALQKKVKKDGKRDAVRQDFENFVLQFSKDVDFSDDKIKSAAWLAWKMAFNFYYK